MEFLEKMEKEIVASDGKHCRGEVVLVIPIEGFKVYILSLLRRMKLMKELKCQIDERTKFGFKI